MFSDTETFVRRTGFRRTGCGKPTDTVFGGSSDTNSRGESLFDFILVKDLDILNVGCKSTFITAEGKQVIDITMCTQNTINMVYDWRISDDDRETFITNLESHLSDQMVGELNSMYNVKNRIRQNICKIYRPILARKENNKNIKPIILCKFHENGCSRLAG